MNDPPPARPPSHAPPIALAVTRCFPDYALLDSGHGRKLERFGAITVDRPEEQAMWAHDPPAQAVSYSTRLDRNTRWKP